MEIIVSSKMFGTQFGSQVPQFGVPFVFFIPKRALTFVVTFFNKHSVIPR